MANINKRLGVSGGETIVVASKDQVFTELDDGVTILGLSDGVYYGLNGVGARVWHLLHEKTKVADVLAHLLREYDVEPAMCEGDLLDLLNELIERGLVEVVRAGD